MAKQQNFETFTLNKRQFLYFDLSSVKSNNDFIGFFNEARKFISDFKPASVYTITNVEGIMFDSGTKDIFIEWLDFNREFVAAGVFINADGSKKIMLNSAFKLARRGNLEFFYTKQQAIDYLSDV